LDTSLISISRGRFASIGQRYKQYLVSLSRDSARPVLPPAVEVPSVVAMQRQRGQQLLCQDLLPRSYSASLWHEEMRTQCMAALRHETYASARLQPVLRDFFRHRHTPALPHPLTLFSPASPSSALPCLPKP
jgi:hypothetical protein